MFTAHYEAAFITRHTSTLVNISGCLGEAKVKGYLYDMGNFPAAVPTEDEAYIVGELYALKNAARLLMGHRTIR